MTTRIFIDGEAGTTGLQIRERLAGRDDLSFLTLDEPERKDAAARARMLNDADIVILCLPDDAARDAVQMIDNPDVRVIDASSAHRTADGWVYGFPELDRQQADKIAHASRVANPGCYALTSVAILYPLLAAGILAKDAALTINAISGYSGGGRKMIEAYEGNVDAAPFSVYGLGLNHRHVPEIKAWSGLDVAPLFVPSVGNFRQGMLVQVPLPGVSADAVHQALSDHYAGQRFVHVVPSGQDSLVPEALNGTNELRLHVFGNAESGQTVVIGLLDNLGKGASGQAVQNLNLMLGIPEDTGLA
ncbi:MAG: N-acetyl-gamma-glutamyl-phosphate reductase [Alphaproteobacteria bacterium]